MFYDDEGIASLRYVTSGCGSLYHAQGYLSLAEHDRDSESRAAYPPPMPSSDPVPLVQYLQGASAAVVGATRMWFPLCGLFTTSLKGTIALPGRACLVKSG